MQIATWLGAEKEEGIPAIWNPFIDDEVRTKAEITLRHLSKLCPP
jgi:hypothetical protein